jgi:hypothetical protein
MNNHLKKLSWLCLVMTIGLATGLRGESHTFTSPDGRTLEAEIQSATNDAVTLKVGKDRIFTSPITKFSESDQKHIAEWRKAHPETIKHNFSIDFTKERISQTKLGPTFTSEGWVCHVTITNRSGQTLDNLEVSYEISVSENADLNGQSQSKPKIRTVEGKLQIPSIKHLEKLSYKTKPFGINLYHGSASRTFDKRIYPGKARQKDGFDGISVRIMQAKQNVFEWGSGPASP